MTDTIGQRIAKARKKAGWTQIQLGKEIGVSSAAVSQWESGKESISLPSLVTIAQKLNVSADWLIFGQLRNGQGTDSLPLWEMGGRSVPLVELRIVDSKLQVIPTNRRIRAYFPCSEKAYATELPDNSNAPRFPKGSIWVVDPEAPRIPGKMVLAGYGNGVMRPVYGRLREEATHAGVITVVQPLHTDWPEARSDLQKLEIIGVATEFTMPAD